MNLMIRGIALKRLSVLMVMILVAETVIPTVAYGLTGGPSQPEVQSFEPVGTTEMVDLFTGDFVYNIPLLDIEGFPINISYHSGVGMDDEASWVGLGWNINPGVVNRNLRGLPDDFNGDQVIRETNIRTNWTAGLTLNPEIELIGKNADLAKDHKKDKETNNTDKEAIRNRDSMTLSKNMMKLTLGYQMGVYYNNYRGLGYEHAINSSFASAEKSGNKFTAGLGVNFNSQGGMDVNANVGLLRNEEDKTKRTQSYTISSGYSTTAGIHSGTISAGYQKKADKQQSVGFNTVNAVASTTFRVRNIYFHPSHQPGMNTFSASGSFRTGSEAFGLFVTYAGSFYYNQQKLRTNSESTPSYGYFYSHNITDRRAQMDITRSNDGAYTKDKPFLPLTSYNYDAFMVAGEGTGGTFRAYRSDVGVVSDPDASNFTTGFGLGFEWGLGGAAKLGLDLKADYGWMTTGKWMSSRKKNIQFNAFHNLRFYQPVISGDSSFIGEHDYEPFYLMNAGDMSRVNDTFYNDRLGMQPFKLSLYSGYKGKLIPKSAFVGTQSTKSLLSLIKQEDRQPRNQVISFLNAGEAQLIGLERCVSSYSHNNFGVGEVSRYIAAGGECVDRTDGVQTEAISEITVLNPDGRRYVYGLPAYNNFQEDVTFNVVQDPDAITRDLAKGLVTYPTGANSTANQFGEDHYYQKVRVPKYAHSFLLTGILSNDYVDILEDGITYDDLGSAIKLNYTRVHTDYKWRVPHGGTSTRSASYNPGNRSDKWDDQGSYIYGEKEIWYVHSIESKNHVAFFYTSARADGHQVDGPDGQIASSGSLYKLDSIALYAKQELIAGDAVPLKVVHFEYDYSLCPNVENNHGNSVLGPEGENINAAKGKLTLKKIYFTYGKSRKGKVSPYQFTYNAFNPEYNMQGYDRWGNYKPTPTHSEVTDLSNPATRLSNNDDPYVLQNKDSIDKYVGAWHLEKIKLPSGGVINIEFESDDYAYVQNLKASRMFKVIGLNNTNSFATKSVLYEDKDNRNNYVFFDLPYGIPNTVGSDSLEKLENLFFKSWENDLYFKFLVDIGNDQSEYEYITGYADVSDVGFVSKTGGSTYDAGYVKLKEVSKNDKDSEDLNPINFAAMNFLRLYLPKKLQKLFGGYELDPGEGHPLRAARNLIPAFKEVGKLFTNQFYEIIKQSACKNVVLNKCFIRLNDPTCFHYGGGSRVKNITISDNWSEISGTGEDAVYGQEYEYTTLDSLSDVGMKISSGVAAYEPGIGNDENPFRRPSTDYTKQKRYLKTIPDDRAYVQLPLGEEFMPPASVGYSKVTSRNIKPSINIHRTGTGHTVNEFYTARDFPVRFEFTDVERHHPRDFIRNFLKVVSTERAYATQGYSIILNDMHGKPKAQSIYQEGGTEPFSSVHYHYYSEYDGKTGKRRLSNQVAVLNKGDGSISTGRLGTTVDVVVDSRQQEGYHWHLGQPSNLDAFLAAILPVAIPSFWPGFSSKRTDVGMVTTTKVVQEYGILKTTVVTENGASIDTRNVLFDGETGDVLMTETQNEFGDTLFSYSIPAHYYYEGMSGAYKNIGFEFRNQYIEEGYISLPNANTFFFPGDEVAFYVKNQPVGVRGWVVKPVENSDTLLYVSRSGDPIHFGDGVKVTVKIIRSGRRNMQNVPIGTVVTLNKPGPSNWNNPTEVINASSVEFSENWTIPYQYIPQFKYIYKLPGQYIGGGAGPCTPTIPCPDTCYEKLQGKMTSSISSNPFLRSNTSREINPKDFEPWYSCARDAKDGCEMCFPYNWDEYFPATPMNKSPFAQDNNLDRPTFNEMVFEKPDYSPVEMAFAGTLIESSQPSTHGPSAPPEVPSFAPFATLSGNSPEWSFDDLNMDLLDSTLWYEIGPCRYMSMKMTFYCTISDPNKAYEITRYGKWDNDVCCRILNDQGVLFEYRYHDFCPTVERESDPRPDSDSTVCGFRYDGFVINPYTQGIRGNWKPSRSWVVLDEREQSPTTNIRKDGTYNLSSFWKTPSGSSNWRLDTTGKWVWSEKMTKYSKTGQNIETVNPLNIYSAAVYGYGDNLPIAVGSNLKLRQIAFDGAEDHPYIKDLHNDHFSFKYAEGVKYSDSAHTGMKSLLVDGYDSTYIIKTLVRCEELTPQGENAAEGYYPRPCDFSEQFSPDTGLYYVSGWIKQNDSLPRTGYVGDTIRFIFYSEPTFTNPPKVQYVVSSGKVIEGWQKIEGVIHVPDSVLCYAVVLKSGASGFTLFDDLRIFPYKANMRSFVYNPYNLRLMAELDENNYATFYEYDEEGRLIRIKRETERGIVTIKESRTGIKKTDQ